MKTLAVKIMVLLFCCASTVYAQKEKTVTGTAQIELLDTQSKVQANAQVLELAKVNALQQAFGTVIVKGNATYVKSVQTGQEAETKTRFNSISNTLVKGEIIKVIKSEFTELKGSNGRREIKCVVKVKVRELTEPPVKFECATLSGNMKNNKAEVFYSGDDFFIYFKSSESGYLTVYLDDTKNTMRLLPYMEMPPAYETGVPVKSDKEYIFFSDAPQHSYFDGDQAYIDTYELESETEKDLNRVFIIFSKEPLNKPLLQRSTEQLEGGYQVPKHLSSEKFQDWMNNNRARRNGMQVKIIDITIQRN